MLLYIGCTSLLNKLSILLCSIKMIVIQFDTFQLLFLFDKDKSWLNSEVCTPSSLDQFDVHFLCS